MLPAQVTFKRLHDVIQNAFNFQGGYPYDSPHLFVFDLPTHGLKVTNDDEAYQIHQEYKKTQKQMEAVLGSLGTSFAQRQLEALRTVVRKPTTLKIDEYLKADGVLNYTYDFGDNWEVLVALEGGVEDYGFKYPTLLGGQEAAPPEDVGGLPGFYEFLKAYYDPKHIDHTHVQVWGKEQGFREYDFEYINQSLKALRLK